MSRPLDVFVIDPAKYGLNADQAAMLQALYSRSGASAREHIEHVKRRGAEKFMQDYVVNYGHASIQRCGSTTVHLEGVSMLATKAVQIDRFYDGQESSTRYIPFDDFGMMSPKVTDDPIIQQKLEEIQKWFFLTYKELSAKLAVAYASGKVNITGDITRYPEDKRAGILDKMYKTRAFDVAGAWLPCGTKTQLSYHNTINGMVRHLPLMVAMSKLVPEYATLADAIFLELHREYPGNLPNDIPQFEHWNENASDMWAQMPVGSTTVNGYARHIGIGNPATALPIMPSALDSPVDVLVDISCEIDFRSYRDIQRHRYVSQALPMVKPESGFCDWYLKELALFPMTESYVEATKEKLQELAAIAESLPPEALYLLQYYCPMGTMVCFEATMRVDDLAHMLELRAKRTVHPTVRLVVGDIMKDDSWQGMGSLLGETVSNIIMSGYEAPNDENGVPNIFCGRGNQDIVKK